MVARASTPGFVRRLVHVSNVVKAVTEFLERIAALLRQVVHVVGWLVLLVAAIKLLIHPDLSPEHFVVPGAGALAVLQSLIRPRPRRRQSIEEAIVWDDTSQLTCDLPSVEVDIEREAAAQPEQPAHP
jgi:hypothetical protein